MPPTGHDVSPEHLEEFRRIYKETCGEEISVGEASAMTHRLLALYKLLSAGCFDGPRRWYGCGTTEIFPALTSKAASPFAPGGEIKAKGKRRVGLESAPCIRSAHGQLGPVHKTGFAASMPLTAAI
jgi:hypothetical protein